MSIQITKLNGILMIRNTSFDSKVLIYFIVMSSVTKPYTRSVHKMHVSFGLLTNLFKKFKTIILTTKID